MYNEHQTHRSGSELADNLDGGSEASSDSVASPANPDDTSQSSRDILDVDAGEINSHASLEDPVPDTVAAFHDVNPPATASTSLLDKWNSQYNASTIKSTCEPNYETIAHLELLQLQHKFGLSLSAVDAIQKWAHNSYSQCPHIFQRKRTTRKRQFKLVKEALGIKHDDGFKEVAIDWLPENKKHPVQVRPFQDCLLELLTNPELAGAGGENINLPHPTDPFKARLPFMSPHTPISQLHHGWWWSETMDELCTEDRDILVPIICYMDGVSTDNNGRLPVTPLNITLGIYDTETRRKPAAWSTILLYPNDDSEASVQRGTESFHKIQNLHNCIALAFRDLKVMMDSHTSFKWKLPYAGKIWDVQLKFAIAYVIGDTEMHDKLCGRYGPRTKNIKCICRHCNCSTESLSKGGHSFATNTLFTPKDLDPDHPDHDSDYFKSISHHPIKNAFHDLYFGCNQYNIHLASPGELLHMVQKGALISVVEGFVQMWTDPNVSQDDVSAVPNHRNSKKLLVELDRLSKIYGEHLSRQSDRNKPRTKFRNSLFIKTKVRSSPFSAHPPPPSLTNYTAVLFQKTGHEHAGVLVCLLCSMISDRGRQIFKQRQVAEAWLENQVYIFELLLQFEQFMKLKEIPAKYGLDERPLGAAMDHILFTINATVQRGENTMGNNTIKNHLLLHIPHYISRWGPPTGMDSGDSERNHKSEVKPQSRWTQRRDSSFLKQFGRRWCETRLVSRAITQHRVVYGLFESQPTQVPEDPVIMLGGTPFSVGCDQHGNPAMGWRDSNRRRVGKSVHPQPVIDFLCHNLLTRMEDNEIHGHTEAKLILNDCEVIVRAHPNYRSDSNQRVHMWYDWATFKFNTQERPGQVCAIVCVGKLKGCHNGTPNIRRQPIVEGKPHAVVRLFDDVPNLRFRESLLGRNSRYTYSIKWGRLKDGFFLLPLSSIVAPAIVVPNIEADPECSVQCPDPLGGGFFVFPSRNQLATDFFDVIDREWYPHRGSHDLESSVGSSGSTESEGGSSVSSTLDDNESDSDHNTCSHSSTCNSESCWRNGDYM